MRPHRVDTRSAPRAGLARPGRFLRVGPGMDQPRVTPSHPSPFLDMTLHIKASSAVHLAAISDLPEIAQLARVIWHRHYPGIISVAQIDYMLGLMYALDVLEREMAAEGVVYFRAGATGALVGFAAVGPLPEPGRFKLHKLYVHPDSQRQGWGRSLLAAVVDHVGRQQGRVLQLAVNKRNVAALAAYERNGFRKCAEVCTPIGEGYVMDDFILELEVAPGVCG